MKNEIVFLGRIGELSLKGGNRKDFEERLVQNARLFLEGSKASVRLSAGRLYIRCPEEKQDDAVFALSHLTGLAGWARVRTAEKTAQAVTAAVLAEAEKAAAAGYKTFKIEARRADKTFPWNSFEIARETGAAVFQAGILRGMVFVYQVHGSIKTVQLAVVRRKHLQYAQHPFKLHLVTVCLQITPFRVDAAGKLRTELERDFCLFLGVGCQIHFRTHLTVRYQVVQAQSGGKSSLTVLS